MRITVHLHSILQIETPGGMLNRLEVDLPQGGTMANLLEHLQISISPDHMLLARNGRVVDLDQALKDGDQVNLMPAISGG